MPLSKIEEALNAEHTGAITIGVNVFYFNKYLHQKEDGEIVETTTYDDGYQKYNINHFEVKLDESNEISIDENYYNCD